MSITNPTMPVLDYSAPALLTEFELELASERARWLRKRFLWFCVVNVALQIFWVVGFARDIREAPPLARALNITETVLFLGGYLAAFIYVLRTRLGLSALLHLAVYITAVFPSLSEIFLRIDLSLNTASWGDMGAGGFGPGAQMAVMSPWLILFLHLIACIFIPWTLRECLLPAAVMLLTNFVIVIADLIFTLNDTYRFMVMGALMLSVLAPAPGMLICWWRFSRFRKRFRLNFESLGYRKLQRELAGARRVHESSLPPQNLHQRGPIGLSYVYEPMREIGGDILFVHPAGDPSSEVVSILLVDVNGHGFGAALMANRVIGEIERLFAEHPAASPHEMLTALNRYVRLTMAKSAVYATALCIRIDTRAGTLQYASGGHPPAFLRKADGTILRLDADTYLLGVFEGDDYCPECKTVDFHSGDALLAYTDGATEARNLAGDMFTVEGLEKRVKEFGREPHRWPQSLLYQITSFRRGPAEDDTLLVALYRV